jgi:hypothetical protein
MAALAATLALSGPALGACGATDDPPAPTTSPRNTAGSIAHSPGGTIVIPRSTTPSTVDLGGSAPAAPAIVRFEVANPARCSSPQLATATARYELAGADRVVFLVDGRQVEGQPPAPSGTFDLPLPCDGAPHIVLITAVSPDDQTTLDNRTAFAPSR